MIDFLVIGGGIAGVSVGARLASLGEVLLLEAEAGLGYHTSGRSAAMFEETYGLPSTVALNKASKSHLASANGGVLSPRGFLLVAGADQRDSFNADVTGMAMEIISLEDAQALVPILNPLKVARTAYHAEAWDIDTDRLIQNFARDIRDSGGTIRFGQRVVSIDRAAGAWVVTTSEESYDAKVLVNAAGSWADEIAAMAGVRPIGLTPFRRSMARIPAPGGHDLSNWPMVFGTGESWYCKPDAGKLIVSPADEDPSHPHDAWPDDMELAEGLARYEEFVTEPVTRLESSWAGLRTFAPDRCLVLGPDAQDPSFVWVAGQGGYGFQSSPAASQLVADLVAGRQSELDQAVVDRLSPSRFRSDQGGLS